MGDQRYSDIKRKYGFYAWVIMTVFMYFSREKNILYPELKLTPIKILNLIECDPNADCVFGSCECSTGYTGMGLDCNAPLQQNRVIVPIRKSPTIKNGVCTDLYWLEIAKLERISVIFEAHTSRWMPCIQMLADYGVDIYGKITANHGKFKNMLGHLKGGISFLTRNFQKNFICLV